MDSGLLRQWVDAAIETENHQNLLLNKLIPLIGIKQASQQVEFVAAYCRSVPLVFEHLEVASRDWQLQSEFRAIIDQCLQFWSNSYFKENSLVEVAQSAFLSLSLLDTVANKVNPINRVAPLNLGLSLPNKNMAHLLTPAVANHLEQVLAQALWQPVLQVAIASISDSFEERPANPFSLCIFDVFNKKYLTNSAIETQFGALGVF